jgi:hypothetical protein
LPRLALDEKKDQHRADDGVKARFITVTNLL